VANPSSEQSHDQRQGATGADRHRVLGRKDPDKPRNVIGIAKRPRRRDGAADPEVLTATPDDLRALANARAAAVRDYLEHTGKVSRDRLFLVERS